MTWYLDEQFVQFIPVNQWGGAVPVSVERHGQVLVAVLDRAEKRNAINRELADDLDAALNVLEDDDPIRVGIVSGPGAFSAGTDILDRRGTRTARGGEYGVVRRVRTKPLIAAIEGLAFGAGLGIVLNCDMVVASRSSTLALPEVRRGLVATSGGLFRAPLALPLNVALELLRTGDSLNAQRCYELGLANRLVDQGTTLTEALKLAGQICLGSPASIRETLAAVRELVMSDDDAGWARTDSAKQNILASPDADEGIAAFHERRAPAWVSGR